MSNFINNIFGSLKESWESVTSINFVQNLKDIFGQPLGIIAVAAVLIILVVLVKARKIRFSANLLAQIGLMVALSTVLDLFKIYKMPQGGSITLGSMVPIILMSLWYGAEIGMLTGLVCGILSLLIGPYVVHPVQLLLDYPLAYLAIGAAGFFKWNKYFGAVAGISLRFICHVVSGVVFFYSYAAEAGYSSSLWYSIVYNGTFLGVDAIICILILAALPVQKLLRSAQKTA
ncbi:MAG: energy-coupled thiamine transporter ThiT [Bacillota bacterium]|nr:energy-coupled thiamine transporter ThiT [Bacillota bacterium]